MGGNLTTADALLNGAPLSLGADGSVPDLSGRGKVADCEAVSLPGYAVALVEVYQ